MGMLGPRRGRAQQATSPLAKTAGGNGGLRSEGGPPTDGETRRKKTSTTTKALTRLTTNVRFSLTSLLKYMFSSFPKPSRPFQHHHLHTFLFFQNFFEFYPFLMTFKHRLVHQHVQFFFFIFIFQTVGSDGLGGEAGTPTAVEVPPPVGCRTRKKCLMLGFRWAVGL